MTQTVGRRVTSIAELRELVGAPSERAVRKQLAALDAHCRAFIELSPFMLLGTSGPDGRCDVSPKGDQPGFVLVDDETTLVIPDRPGNKRFDSLQNILHNPHVGLLFLIPGMDETLRVNGSAALVPARPGLGPRTVHPARRSAEPGAHDRGPDSTAWPRPGGARPHRSGRRGAHRRSVPLPLLN